MRYENIQRAIFLKRENRFVARVLLGGKEERVHVKNTGRLGELLLPGAEVILSGSGKAERKTAYDLIGVYHAGKLFNIDSQACNQVVREWLLESLPGGVKPEKTYKDSRLDFYWEEELGGERKESDKAEKGREKGEQEAGSRKQAAEAGRKEKKIRRVFLEVKGCTLEKEGVGYFPDAPTSRGAKHLHDLVLAREEGYEAHVGFVIQMEGVLEVRANAETDPTFATALSEARKAGVGISYFLTAPLPEEIFVTRCLGSLAYLVQR